MATDKNQGASPNFWTTLPGVITAVTGLVTAVGGLIVVLYTVGPLSIGETRQGEPPQPVSPEEPANLVVVPHLVGRGLDEAVSEIEAFRLRVGEVREVPAHEPPGIILEQDPPEGLEVPEGTPINLVLALPP